MKKGKRYTTGNNGKSRWISRMLILLLFNLVSGCSEESTPIDTEEEEDITFRFGVEIPDLTGGQATRAFGENIDAANASIKLVLFDENHLLTNAFEGTYESTSDGCNYYSITMKKTDQKRIVHVIVNDNDLNISDIPYGLEADIFTSTLLSVNHGTDVYWGRKEITGINKETTPDELSHITLVRNFAKVVVNLDGIAATNMSDAQWTLMGIPAKGSVAPYLNEQSFADYFAGENGTISTYDNLYTQGYTGNIPRTPENAATFYLHTQASEIAESDWKNMGEASYLFENEGASSNTLWQKTAIIIRGKFKSDDAYSYYRVALTNKDRNYEVLNILRNFKYQLTVSSITSEGYSTIDEAFTKAALNDISGATETSGYNYVSLDQQVLNVEYVKKYILSPDEFTLKVKYIPDVSNTSTDTSKGDGTYVTDNSKVYLTYADPYTGSTVPAFVGDVKNGFSINEITDETSDTSWKTYKFKPNIALTNQRSITSTIRVAIEGTPGLYRNISFILRERYLMDNMKITKEADTDDDKNCFILSCDVPNNLPEEIFPLDITIEAYPACIYPNPSESHMEVEGNQTSLFSDVSETTFHFHRRISVSSFNATGDNAYQEENGKKRLPFYFKVNTNAIASGKKIRFAIYCSSFSSDPDADREKGTPQILEGSFTFTNTGEESNENGYITTEGNYTIE